MWCVMYILVFLVVVEVEGVVVRVGQSTRVHGEAPAEAAPATARAEGRRRRPALRRRREAPAVVGLEAGPRGRGEGRAGEVSAQTTRRAIFRRVELRSPHGADGVRRVPRGGFRSLREPSERAAAKLPKENPGCFLAQRCSFTQSKLVRVESRSSA